MNRNFKNLVLKTFFLGLLFILFASASRAEEPGNIIHSASELDYPPFSIVTEDGQAGGFSVELFKAALSAAGREADFYVAPWAKIKNDLAEGRIDALPLVGRTPEREALFDFTVPYLTLYGAVFTREDNEDINSREDLGNKEILVMAEDNSEEYVRRDNISLNIITTASYEEAFRLLSAGKYDAVVAQELVGRTILEDMAISNVAFKFILKDFKQDFTFAVKKGDGGMLHLLNKGLSKVIVDGTYDKIHEKWLGGFEAIRYGGQTSEKSIIEGLIRKRTEDIASLIEDYIALYPRKNRKEFEKDQAFRRLVSRNYGEKSYGVLADPATGYLFLHPDSSLLNKDLSYLKDSFPAFWDLFQESLQEDKCGLYEWENKDGRMANKYLCSRRLSEPIGNEHFVYALTVDIDSINDVFSYKEEDQNKDTNRYSFAKERIRQKALDVAKQVEIYIRSNPDKTVKDLQADSYFQDIAVQAVGKTGYTAITDLETSEQYFTAQKEMVGVKLEELQEQIPKLWEFFEEEVRGRCGEAGLLYEWPDENGVLRPKYAYEACVPLRTADGRLLGVDASTYLDEYGADEYMKESEKTAPPGSKEGGNPKEAPGKRLYWLFGGLLVILIFLFILNRVNLKAQKKSYVFFSIAVSLAIITSLFFINNHFTAKELKRIGMEAYIEEHSMIQRLESQKVNALLSSLGYSLSFLSRRAAGLENKSEAMDHLLKDVYEYSNLYAYASYRISREGLIDNMYPPDYTSLGSDISAQAHMIKIKATLQPVLSDVFDSVEGFKAVTLHYPVIVDGRYDGTVAFLLDLEQLFDSLEIFKEKKHEHLSLLLDGSGTVILSEEGSYIGKDINEIDLFKNALPQDSAGRGAIIFNFKGRDYLAINSPLYIVDNAWRFLLAGPAEEAYSSIGKAFNELWVFTIIIILSIIFLGLFFSFALSNSLQKEIEEKTEELKSKSGKIEKQLIREKELFQEQVKLMEKQKKSEKKLKEKVAELEKFQKLTVDREVKMIELKKRIKDLENKMLP